MTRGRVHNVKEVDMTKRQTTSTQCDVRGRDVTSTASSVGGRSRSDSSIANPAKIFYCDMICELYCSKPGFLNFR